MKVHSRCYFCRKVAYVIFAENPTIDSYGAVKKTRPVKQKRKHFLTGTTIESIVRWDKYQNLLFPYRSILPISTDTATKKTITERPTLHSWSIRGSNCSCLPCSYLSNLFSCFGIHALNWVDLISFSAQFLRPSSSKWNDNAFKFKLASSPPLFNIQGSPTRFESS